MRKTAWILAILLLSGTAMAADFTGTWKLNQEKSPDPRTNVISLTMTLEQIGPNAYRTTIDSVSKSGKTRHVIDRIYDGKERHVDDAPPEGTEICEITPDGVRKITMKNAGKVVEVIEAIISADGKTMTHIITDAKGKQVAIFDRQ